MKQGTQIQIKLRRMQELFFNATFFTSHGGASAKHMGDFRPKKKVLMSYNLCTRSQAKTVKVLLSVSVTPFYCFCA